MIKYYLISAAVWAALLAFFIWRFLRCWKRVRPVTREITWSVYLLTLPLLVLVGALFPELPRPAGWAVLAVWMLGSGVVSYRLNRKFNDWVDAERKRKEQER